MKTLTNYLSLLFIAVLAITLNSCEKDKADLISLNSLEKTFYYEDGYQIEATSKSAISYTVANNYHATVTQEGYVTAGRVGETTILLKNAEDKHTFKVIVNPKYNLYPEPKVHLGDTKSSIISQFGSNYTESESTILYTDYSSAAPIIMFLFNTNNTLKAYVIMVKSSYSSILASFLVERYIPVTEEDGLFLFANGLSSATTSIVVAVKLYNTSYWMVSYQPFISTAVSSETKYITTSNGLENLLKTIVR